MPPALKSKALVRVVAPSGPFEGPLLEAGLARLSDYRVLASAQLAERRQGFLAGSDEERRKELQDALDCPRAAAIWVARGGYGLSRIAGGLSFEGFAENPKWIVGFSDATVLHLLAQKAGYASLHAANGTTLARASDHEVQQLICLLSGKTELAFEGLTSLAPGMCSGQLVGGNLTVLFAEAAAGRLRWPPGAVVLLEDVTETSYRIDRMLTALHLGGYLSAVAGVVLGDFHQCSAGKFDVPVADVLSEHACRWQVPVVSGLPVGHGAHNRALPLGALARLDARAGTLALSLNP